MSEAVHIAAETNEHDAAIAEAEAAAAVEVAEINAEAASDVAEAIAERNAEQERWRAELSQVETRLQAAFSNDLEALRTEHRLMSEQLADLSMRVPPRQPLESQTNPTPESDAEIVEVVEPPEEETEPEEPKAPERKRAHRWT